MPLLPDKHSQFITQIQEQLVVRIVDCPHGVRAQILHQSQVVMHDLQRDGAPVVRMILVTAEAPDLKRLSVQEKLRSLHCEFPETDAVDQIVEGSAGSILQDCVKVI